MLISGDDFLQEVDNLGSAVVNKGVEVTKVVVAEPQETKRRFGMPYTTYSITVTPAIQDITSVRRRYSDFVWLRKQLVDTFPGMFIPPLPPKSLLGNKKEKFIEERQRGLQEFMDRLIERNQCFINCTPFQLFVTKHSTTYDKGKKAVEKSISKLVPADANALYGLLFPTLGQVSIPEDGEKQIERLKQYLSDSAKQVQTLLESSSTISKKWDDIVKSSSKVTESLESLNKVEDGYAQRPEPARPDVIGKFKAWGGVISRKPTQWSDIVVEIFKCEKLDIEAMQEVVKNWENLRSKKNRAAATMEGWSKRTSSRELTDKQKTTMAKDQQDKDDLDKLYELTTKILFESELIYFWECKMQKFNFQVNNFFQSQLKTSTDLAKVWDSKQ